MALVAVEEPCQAPENLSTLMPLRRQSSLTPSVSSEESQGPAYAGEYLPAMCV